MILLSFPLCNFNIFPCNNHLHINNCNIVQSFDLKVEALYNLAIKSYNRVRKSQIIAIQTSDLTLSKI